MEGGNPGVTHRTHRKKERLSIDPLINLVALWGIHAVEGTLQNEHGCHLGNYVRTRRTTCRGRLMLPFGITLNLKYPQLTQRIPLTIGRSSCLLRFSSVTISPWHRTQRISHPLAARTCTLCACSIHHANHHQHPGRARYENAPRTLRWGYFTTRLARRFAL